MGVKYTNNGEGTLTAVLLIDQTDTLELTAGDGVLFPTVVSGAGDWFWATLIDTSDNLEIIKVTEHQAGTNVFQAFLRAQDDTAARAYAIGDKVELRVPKIILEEFRDDIETNETNITSNDVDIAALQARDTADEQVLYAPSGLTMYMYNPAAEIPTGWSAKSGPADCLLAIAGGTQDYNVAGENLAGDWAPTVHTHTGPGHVHTGPSHVHTGPAHTHTGGLHALTAAELPTHSHTGKYYPLYNLNGCGQTGTFNGYGVALTPVYPQTGEIGSDDEHSHGATSEDGTGDTGASGTANTGSSGTAATGSSGAPSTDRPYAAVGLLIERD